QSGLMVSQDSSMMFSISAASSLLHITENSRKADFVFVTLRSSFFSFFKRFSIVAKVDSLFNFNISSMICSFLASDAVLYLTFFVYPQNLQIISQTPREPF